jgi:hypothetical protein
MDHGRRNLAIDGIRKKSARVSTYPSRLSPLGSKASSAAAVVSADYASAARSTAGGICVFRAGNSAAPFAAVAEIVRFRR